MVEDKNPVYCMHCTRWYAPTKVDQCNLPSKEERVIDSHEIGMQLKIKDAQYGHPSVLNKNNDCEYYLDVGFFGKLKRKIFYNIALKPTIVSKLE